MDNPVLITDPQHLNQLDGAASFWPSGVRELAALQPDAHWMLLGHDDRPAARCSLWWHGALPYADHRVGVIGQFAALSRDASIQLLHHACGELSKRGVTLAVGPMDGNTWRQYRFVTERSPRPPFFLEPDNPNDWPEHWAASGFAPIASYSSRLNSDLSWSDPRAQVARDRLHAQGVRLRSLNLAQFEHELEKLYGLVVSAFERNLLYSPIPFEEFVQQYRRLQPILRPELIHIAEHEDKAVGLIFSLPDVLQAQRGQAIDTAIIKTLVISRERTYAGLGSWLTAHNQTVARELGYAHVIHALMHESSKSQSISARYGRVLRRYALYGKVL